MSCDTGNEIGEIMSRVQIVALSANGKVTCDLHIHSTAEGHCQSSVRHRECWYLKLTHSNVQVHSCPICAEESMAENGVSVRSPRDYRTEQVRKGICLRRESRNTDTVEIGESG